MLIQVIRLGRGCASVWEKWRCPMWVAILGDLLGEMCLYTATLAHVGLGAILMASSGLAQYLLKPCPRPLSCPQLAKGVILWIYIPHMLAKQKHRKQTDSASGMQGSKVTKVESSMIEKEAMESKHKDFITALYLTGMHSHKAEEWACSFNHPSAIENSTFSGMCLYAGWD